MRFVWLVLIAFATACHASIPDYPYTKEPDPRGQELVLGVGDVVGINVWDQKDLNTDATIRPDGTITMPLIGDVRAAGETPSALKAKIKDQLGNFVKVAATNEISVAVKSWRSYRFTITGEVGKPGVYTPEQYMRVTDAVAIAGGLTRFARRDGVKILRTEPKTGAVRQIPLDYDALASGQRLDMNIFVLPGDLIYVP
jgi:polysaccharide export outer membrane protein